MTTPISDVADKFNDMLLKSGENVVTLSYPEFYEATERERIKDAFKRDLEQRLRERGLLICYGAMIVAILKDFRFAPQRSER